MNEALLSAQHVSATDRLSSSELMYKNDFIYNVLAQPREIKGA